MPSPSGEQARNCCGIAPTFGDMVALVCKKARSRPGETQEYPIFKEIHWLGSWTLFVTCFLVLFWATNSLQAQVAVPFSDKGTITAVNEGNIHFKNENGKEIVACFPKGNPPVVEVNGKYRFRPPEDLEVKVQGKIDVSTLAVGDTVQFSAILNRLAKVQEPVKSIVVVNRDSKASAEVEEDKPASDGNKSYLITGMISSIRNDKFSVKVPKKSGSQSVLIIFDLDPEAECKIDSSRYDQALPGDSIEIVGFQHEGKDIFVKSATVNVAKERTKHTNDKPELASNSKDAEKYSKLSDEPREPRVVRSQHYFLNTDVSDRAARELLDKLEVMYELVTAYYGREPNLLPIQLYYVRDFSQWPEETFPAEAKRKILQPAGVTIGTPMTFGNRSGLSVIAYSYDDPGVAQHECVHAICMKTFGGTGPTWYSEGMAEMGQYWKKGQLKVDIDIGVVNYLQRSEPKKLQAILVPDDPPGTWEDYAWRWALCHMLEMNPNYRAKLKPLGIALMKREPASFEKTYGDVAKEVSFEYDFFLKHFGNGYRVDLCYWNWKAKFGFLRKNQKKTAKVIAKSGWQPSMLEVQKGDVFAISTKGEWQIEKDGEKLTADGDSKEDGALFGVLMDKEYALTEPFKLGANTTWTAPKDGRLYLRCNDQWTKIADNAGTITVVIQAQ